MDTQKLIDLLRATVIELNQEQRKAAETELAQLHKIIGFAPTVLQIVMQSNVEQPVRQAGAIYLKHIIINCWADHETKPGEPLRFSIHEQDRAMIRAAIVDAIVRVPDLIRVQLSSCVNHIIKNDFPDRWPEVVDNISIYLQNNDVNGWSGALLVMYQLVKTYEFDCSDERVPLNEAMNLLLPMIYRLMIMVMNDPTEQSQLLQKHILKIYYALTQHSLPLELITRETFSRWMEICLQVADRPIPDCSHLSNDAKPKFPWWKTKKWALHIILHMFERYGCTGGIDDERDQKFAKWILHTFTPGALRVVLKILDQYRNQVYVSPRVLTDVLGYLKNAVSHSHSWKIIKPHMVAIIQDVIFPIMLFTDAHQELWETNPHEYINLMLDIFDYYSSPVPAAQSLLHSVCKKRTEILPKAMNIIMQVITSPNADNKQKDGALHMIGTLADVLLKRQVYRDQVENMLTTYVFPEFQNPAGHVRARACWVLYHFCNIQVNSPEVLGEIMRLATYALLNDNELPVKVEAAIALLIFLSSQDNAAPFVERQIPEITRELLAIIRENGTEDLTNVLQKIVCIFTEQLLPVAIEMSQNLATTLIQVLESEDFSDQKILTAQGLLNTIATLLRVMEDHPNVMQNVHPIAINVVGYIFQHHLTDYYEEAFSMVFDLTAKAISPEMWQMLELIYQVFNNGGIDYFINIMPALHNYVTVDSPAFLSNPDRLLAMFDMCKTMLTSMPGEDPECHAAKLLEIIILQCKGQIDSVIPMFVELALSRLTREVQSSELRTMCLQVVIAALYYNPQLCLLILDKLSQATNEPIALHFVKQWLHDMDYFLGIHNRKLCVLGLCTLISLGEAMPPVLREVAAKIMPSLILLFDGLKRAYEFRDQVEEEEEEAEEDEVYESDFDETLPSDKGEVDAFGPGYLEQIADHTKVKVDETPEEEGSIEYFKTTLEYFNTTIDKEEAIDEYVTFKEVITAVSTQDLVWYTALTSGLTPEQAKALQGIVVTADQRRRKNQN